MDVVRIRSAALIGALLIALLPHPAHAQGEFIKNKLTNLIQKSGIYLGTSTRTSPDNDVVMARTWGVSYGTASKSAGWKFPFSLSGYRADLESSGGTQFGDIRTRQIISGIGYQWAHGKMIYSAQLGVGYSFNKIALDAAAASAAFTTAGQPVSYDIDNSWVIRPQVKAEYFFHRKASIRAQLGYTFTDPDVVIVTPTETLTREWRPHHVQFNVSVGFFPFLK
jgi:hypothetical protein